MKELILLFTSVFGLGLLFAYYFALSENPKKELVRLLLYLMLPTVIVALVYVAVRYSRLSNIDILIRIYQILCLFGIVFIAILWREFVDWILNKWWSS